MDDDKMQRQMEFIVEHQAQFQTNMEVLARIVHEHSTQIERHSEQIAALKGEVSIVNERTEVILQTVADQTALIAKVAYRGRETDGKLNILIDTVNRMISARGNGDNQ
jgi:septal ring factor EnvC (AmiA/AmiB activator)